LTPRAFPSEGSKSHTAPERSGMIQLQERELAISTCTDAVDAAVQGNGMCVIVYGGAGVGKSALLDEVISRASEQGLATLRFRGNHAEHETPLNFALRVLEFIALQVLDDAAFYSMAREQFTDKIEDSVQGGPWSASKSLLTDLIREIERSRIEPFLLAIDNLHWVDRYSLGWLSAFLERFQVLPVAVVTTMCDGLAGTDPELLDEVVAGAARSVKIGPLSSFGVAAVIEEQLRQVPHPAFLAAVMQATNGNPLMLHALLQRVREVGVSSDDRGAKQLLSLSIDSLAPSLRVRLRRISPHAISVFRIAAVLDSDATVQNIADLSGIAPADVAEDCFAMRKMGILFDDSKAIVITQPLMARAVLRDSSPSVLLDVHAQAARLLHELGATDPRIAPHLLVGGVMADAAWVCETLRSAAREAVTEHDIPGAIRYLKRALEEPLSEISRVAVHTDLAALTAGSNVEEAARLVGRAMRLSAEEVGKQAAPDLLMILGLGEYWDEVRCLYTAAQTTQGIAFDAALLFLECFQHSLPPSIPSPAPIIADAGHQEMLLQACEMARSGRDRQDAVLLASQVAQRPGSSIEQIMCQLQSARVLRVSGSLTTAIRVINIAIASAEERGHGPMLAVTLVERSRIALRLGEIDTAIGDSRRALRLAHESGFGKRTSVFTTAVALLISTLVEMGSTDEAQALMSSFETSARGMEESSADLLHAVGRIRVLTGDLRGGVRDLLACGELLSTRNCVNPAIIAWRSHAAFALDRLGETDQAHQLLEEELSLLRCWGSPGATAAALRVQAMLSDPQPALQLLEEAVALLRQSDDRLSLVRALCEHGRLLAAVDVGAARQLFRDAYELAAGLGLDDYVSEIRRELVLHGGRVPRVAQQGVAGLTESELKVAGLAVQGLKNREIAAKLYVEKRTVEIHLTRTYRKLGIGSRGELAKALNTGVAPV
jgi:DNA-binding CsgD family transcriptional regulator